MRWEAEDERDDGWTDVESLEERKHRSGQGGRGGLIMAAWVLQRRDRWAGQQAVFFSDIIAFDRGLHGSVWSWVWGRRRQMGVKRSRVVAMGESMTRAGRRARGASLDARGPHASAGVARGSRMGWTLGGHGDGDHVVAVFDSPRPRAAQTMLDSSRGRLGHGCRGCGPGLAGEAEG